MEYKMLGPTPCENGGKKIKIKNKVIKEKVKS
jgi:hypothetical protein